MNDDERLAKILLQSGIVPADDVEKLLREREVTKPPSSLFDLVVARGLATPDRIRAAVDQAGQYSETKVAAIERLGKFELRGELGRGGMGIVYRAWQPDLERTVALKVLPPSAEPGLKERFLREARTASRLKHPNIVAVHEFGEHDGHAYFSMDLVRGDPFDERLKSRPLAENVRVIAAVARALDFAHAQGVVHRDVKPQNILVAQDGTAVLTDFGLAFDVNARSALTRSGQILGTPAFMSPEQARGRDKLGPASDLYSLGAVLYVALAGRPPFEETTVYDLLDAIVRRAPESPSKASGAAIPGPLERICLKCLAKDPAARYASGAELATDLERCIEGAATVSPRRRQVLPLVAIAATVLLGIVAYVASRAGGEAAPPVVASVARWTHDLTDPRQARDWQIQPGAADESKAFNARVDGSGLLLRNLEAAFRVPIGRDGDLRVVFAGDLSSPFGIQLGGARLVRTGGGVTLRLATGRTLSMPIASPGPTVELGLRFTADRMVASVDGATVLEEPLAEPASPVRPSIFSLGQAPLRATRVELTGIEREGWAAENAAERTEFEKVGKAYELDLPRNLLAGGPLGAFQKFRSGTWSLEGGELVVKDPGGDGWEIHGPAVRNSRIRFKYRIQGPHLRLRVQAGYRDVTYWLPGDGGWRDVEIVCLEHLNRGTLDGVLDVSAAQSNGGDDERITLRLKGVGPGFGLKNATIEEIRGVPPQDPWIVLHQNERHDPRLSLAPGWRHEGADVLGTGVLRTLDAWGDVDLEMLAVVDKPGTRLSVGFEGRAEFESTPVPNALKAHSWVMRVRGDRATLEEPDRWRSTSTASKVKAPLVIRGSGGEPMIFAIRLRPAR